MSQNRTRVEIPAKKIVSASDPSSIVARAQTCFRWATWLSVSGWKKAGQNRPLKNHLSATPLRIDWIPGPSQNECLSFAFKFFKLGLRKRNTCIVHGQSRITAQSNRVLLHCSCFLQSFIPMKKFHAILVLWQKMSVDGQVRCKTYAKDQKSFLNSDR